MAKNPAEGIPKVLNHDTAKALLGARGWIPTIGGKHSTKMEKEGKRPITLPRHHGQDYSKDLRSQILRQAGLKGASQEADDLDSASGE